MTKFWSLIMLFALSATFAKEPLSQTPPEKLNIKYMLRGYFYAGSYIEDEFFGGFAKSDNLPKAITAGMLVPPSAISLIALPNEAAIFNDAFKGIKLLLVNTTLETVALSASDSRIEIVQEAQDANGEWRPIDYLPSSWCGNSYHQVFLEQNQYWEFVAAEFTGTLNTKLRFRLSGLIANADRVIYSNQFDGMINPEQFSVKREYHPQGLMDPYDD